MMFKPFKYNYTHEVVTCPPLNQQRPSINTELIHRAKMLTADVKALEIFVKKNLTRNRQTPL